MIPPKQSFQPKYIRLDRSQMEWTVLDVEKLIENVLDDLKNLSV